MHTKNEWLLKGLQLGEDKVPQWRVFSEWNDTDRKIRFVGSTIYYHELHGDTHVATMERNIIGVAGSYN